MRYIADTHLMLWMGLHPHKLSRRAQDLLGDPGQNIYFSTVCIWEAAIKFALKKKDFTLAPAAFREGLLREGFQELSITSEHVIAVADLPLHHRDPFDRLLVAQAVTEQVTLLTSDKVLSRYPNTLLV